MQQHKIVFQGKTKKGNEIIVRYPVIEDAETLMNYINTLSRERTFILKQGEQMSFEGEKKFLNNILEKIGKKQSIMLLVFKGEETIGNCVINLQEKVNSHVGGIGISLAQEYRGEGIGKLLMNLLLDEARKNLPQIKIATLEVFANNRIAILMYQKLGFVEYGKLPRGIFHQNKYIDRIFMYKNL